MIRITFLLRKKADLSLDAFQDYWLNEHGPLVASVARGVWSEGRWSVVFARPMETHDTGDYQFAPGTRDVMAFAIWEGHDGNVSGRKQHSQWVVFEIEP